MRAATLALLACLTLAPLAMLLPAEAAGTRTVSVITNAYEDEASGNAITEITPGTTVNWVWLSGTHSVTQGITKVTPVDPLGGFHSGNRRTEDGATFSVTFDTTGDFVYFCTLHATMRGVVRVAG